MRPLFKRFSLKTVQRFLFKKLAQAMRWIYNLDGATNRGQLLFRAINPDGDIRIEWSLLAAQSTGSWACIVSQSILDNGGQREFGLYVSPAGALEVRVGGNMLTISNHNFYQSGRYAVEITVNRVLISFNQALIADQPFTRGSARESSALTVIGARPNNSMSSFTAFFRAVVYDFRINGVLYPIADRNQAIQLPNPSGLSAELINLTNIIWDSASSDTFVSGDSFGFTALDTWGQRSFRIPITIQANVPYLFDIEVTGGYNEGEMIRVTLNDKLGDGAPHVTPVSVSAGVNTPFDISSAYYGSYRDFGRVINGRVRGIIIIPNATNLNWFIGLRAQNNQNGRVVRLRNLTMRPLWVASTTELVTNGNFSSGTAGWTVTGGGTIAVSNGQCTLTTVVSQNSRFEQLLSLEAGAYYVAEADLVSVSGVTHARLWMLRGAAGGYLPITNATGSSVGGVKLRLMFMATASDAIIQINGDSTNAGTITVDNISVRKLDSICNPLTLINTTSPGWQQFDPNAPLPNFNFSQPNNSQYLPLL